MRSCTPAESNCKIFLWYIHFYIWITYIHATQRMHPSDIRWFRGRTSSFVVKCRATCVCIYEVQSFSHVLDSTLRMWNVTRLMLLNRLESCIYTIHNAFLKWQDNRQRRLERRRPYELYVSRPLLDAPSSIVFRSPKHANPSNPPMSWEGTYPLVWVH